MGDLTFFLLRVLVFRMVQQCPFPGWHQLTEIETSCKVGAQVEQKCNS